MGGKNRSTCEVHYSRRGSEAEVSPSSGGIKHRAENGLAYILKRINGFMQNVVGLTICHRSFLYVRRRLIRGGKTF